MNAPGKIKTFSRSRLVQRGQASLRHIVQYFLVVVATTAVGPAQSPKQAVMTAPVLSWVEAAANNEISVIKHPSSYLRYRYHVVDDKGDQVRDQIETPEGSVARLMLRDGRPLTADEDAAERSRLTDLLNSPASFEHHIRREQNNKEIGIRLIGMLPKAMLWSYAPGQPQLPGHTASEPALVVLDFKPNPKWSAPDIESEPLTGLQGRVWIDPTSHYVVGLEGDVVHAINVGWGMVAHIYPGGKVKLQQTDADGQRWIVQHIVEQLTIRAFMVKTFKQQIVFDTSDYVAVPPMKYQDAIRLLLNTPLPK